MQLPKLTPEWQAIIFDESPAPMALVTACHRFARCNDAYCALVGYSRSELLSRTWQSITAGEDIDGDLQGAEHLAENDDSQIYTVEKRYRTKAGPLVWVKLHVRAVWLEGHFEGYYVTALPLDKPSSATPKSVGIIEWTKKNPKDATIVSLAGILLLGRDDFVELLKLWIK
jgi:PAS domain S-box-containing protein